MCIRDRVNIDDLVEKINALNCFMRACLAPRTVELCGQMLVQDLIDQRRLARAGNARHAGERAQRNGNVDLLQIVFRRCV